MPGQDLWFASALLPQGWADGVRLSHADGRITGIEAGVAPAPGDDAHAIGLPGLGNLHSHAFQRAIAGLAEVSGPAGDDFWTWRQTMYRFVDQMRPEDLEAIAGLAFAEMLQSGFTQVGEFHYLHHDPDGRPHGDIGEMSGRIAAAAETTGIGLTLLPVFYGHGGFGGAPTHEGQRRFLNDLNGFARLHARAAEIIKPLAGARIGVAPHSLRATTPDELAELVKLAPSGPIHIHAAEQMREVEDCIAWSGARPIQWLLDKAGVDDRWCVVHATHMTEAETVGLAQSGAVAGLCPITEANLGDGVFPAAAYQAAGGRYGVGSDSNVAIDAAGELCLLEYSQRLSLRQRNVLAGGAQRSTGANLYSQALAGGAQALGLAGSGLTVGASLDLVSLKDQHPAFMGRSGDAFLDGLIFGGGAGKIDCVWRAGLRVVAHGQHRQMPQILTAYRQTLTRLLSL